MVGFASDSGLENLPPKPKVTRRPGSGTSSISDPTTLRNLRFDHGKSTHRDPQRGGQSLNILNFWWGVDTMSWKAHALGSSVYKCQEQAREW